MTSAYRYLSDIPHVKEVSPLLLLPHTHDKTQNLPLTPDIIIKSTRCINYFLRTDPSNAQQTAKRLNIWARSGDKGLARHIIENYDDINSNDNDNEHIDTNDLIAACIINYIFDYQQYWENKPIILSHFSNCRENGLLLMKNDVNWEPKLDINGQIVITKELNDLKNTLIHGFTTHRVDDTSLMHLHCVLKNATLYGPYDETRYLDDFIIGHIQSSKDCKETIYTCLDSVFKPTSQQV